MRGEFLSETNYEVLLINPPSQKDHGGRGEFFIPPMGLGYIASYLKQHDVSVDLIDCDAESLFVDYFSPESSQEKNFKEKMASYGPKPPRVIGVGPCTTPFLANSLAVAQAVKRYFPTSFLILGGPHVSTTPPEMAKRMLSIFSYIDGICINEGEVTCWDLVQALRGHACADGVLGLVVRTRNGFSYQPRDLLTSDDLSELPFPNRTLILMHSDKYRLAVRRSFAQITSNQSLLQKYGKNPAFTPIFSSRGCPYGCTFCCSMPTRRTRTPESLVGELKECINRYQIHCFVFYDDLFTTSSPLEIERVRNICNLILSANLEVFWEVELRANVIVSLGRDLLALMNKAGCCTVSIGIEKATDSALEDLSKQLTIRDIRDAIALLRDSGGFIINGTFILGGPTETEDDIQAIIEFSRSLDIDYAAYYPLEIHPGTKVFDKAKSIGLIEDILTPYIEQGRSYPLFINPRLSEDNLKRLQCKAYQDFYMDGRKIESLVSRLGSVYTVYEQYKHFFEHAFIQGIR